MSPTYRAYVDLQVLLPDVGWAAAAAGQPAVTRLDPEALQAGCGGA